MNPTLSNLSLRSCIVLLQAAAVALGMTFAGAASAQSSVIGSGKIQTETRPVSGFQAIELKLPAKLVLRQGDKEGVEIKADDNILPLIETRVVQLAGVPTLEIRARNNSSYSIRTEPVVTVDLIKLSALTVAASGGVVADGLKGSVLKVAITGAGDIRIDKLAVDDLGVKVTGSGDVHFSGRVGKFAVAIAGSGGVDTAKLEADDVSVSISGSGDADVNARKTLSVSIAGSGDVTYRGAAVPKTAIAGSGSVTKK